MDRIGRYKIVRELGRGAMGVVYHAIDPNIGRPVAIKTIQLGGPRKPDEQERLRERLFREARSAGMLSHPGIVTIYDVEQQGELAYIAMEFVDGPTLDQLLSDPQPLAPNRMFGILAQTAAALDYAHSKGIVHRDIKPANIMIAGDGTAKITDFGIAKITAAEQFTMTGSIVGTPHYMSPEQVQGQAVDGRSDQFSLAVIAFEMLTGEKPYTGEHLTTVVYKIVAEEPVAPHRINSTLSGPIENAMRKGLAKKADARYRTCSEFIDALEKACASTKGWKPMPRGGSLNAPTMAEGARPAVTLPPGRRPIRGGGTATVDRGKKRSGFLPFLAAILMAAALLALIGWQAGQPSAPHTGETTQPRQPPATAPTGNTQAADAQSTAQGATPQNTAQGTAQGATQSTTQSESKPSPMPAGESASTGPVAEPKPPEETVAAKQERSPEQTQPLRTRPVQTPAQPPAQPEDVPKPVQRPPAQIRTPAPEIPVRRQPALQPRTAAASQAVMVITSPSGATATLDGHPDQACKTPCPLDASAGRHTIAFTLPGYQIEHRDVTVGSESLELPAVILHAFNGVLMLSSTPPGASILVNGQPVPETTPAQLSLAPGTYKISIQKNGSQSVKTVEIHNGDTQVLKVTLGQ
jgi:serine/threonine-protein kinase